MISRDGATFIWYAQALDADPAAAMKSHDQHPLYPALILGAHKLLSPVRHFWPRGAVSDAVLGWQIAGMLVTLVAGLATVAAVYTLTRSLFDAATALWAALLAAAAAELCQLSADVLSDMPHLALYLFALTCGVLGFRRQRPAWWFAAGGLSGLAFLCRPEGAEVAVAGAVTLLTARGWRWVFRIRALALVSIGALLVASPYMLLTGTLIRKKPLQEFVARVAHPSRSDRCGLDDGTTQAPPTQESRHQTASMSTLRTSPTLRSLHDESSGLQASCMPQILARVSDLPGPIRASLLIGERYAQCLRVTLMLPAVAYLLFRRRLAAPDTPVPDAASRPAPHPAAAAIRQMLLTIALMHIAIVYRLLFSFDYWRLLSVRHVLVLGAITLPYSAAGLRLLLAAVPAPRWRPAVILLLAVLIGPTLPWMLERRNMQDVYLRRAGEWIRSRQPAGARILTTRNMVAFYAHGVHVWSPPDHELARILAEVQARRPDWLVLDEQRCLKGNPRFFDELSRASFGDLSIDSVHRESQRNRDKMDTAVVYRLRPSPGLR